MREAAKKAHVCWAFVDDDRRLLSLRHVRARDAADRDNPPTHRRRALLSQGRRSLGIVAGVNPEPMLDRAVRGERAFCYNS